jgi:hypothetical protein
MRTGMTNKRDEEGTKKKERDKEIEEPKNRSDEIVFT